MEEKDNIQRDVSDKYSLRGRVYQQLREDILNGRYKCGDELKEVAVGETYGVSRTPVRDAFHQLELEGLITIVPNKGAIVDGISPKDVVDIYEIRSRLEGLAAKWACEHITKDQREQMEEILYMSDFHAGRSHWEKVTELDSSFHELMYEASGSKRLEILLKDYHQYVHSIRMSSLSKNDRSRISNDEHKQIAEAIFEGRQEDAERFAHQHILNALENSLDNGLRDLINKERA
ncbi:DNA-binding transcriptional regulator, GntR family [Lachnospiraceae bacterium]|nr:DNA-binding transcriptional regulator, GntR family [Lachnospiraceae bacterium]